MSRHHSWSTRAWGFALALVPSLMPAAARSQTAGRYATINGIRMYYEVHGAGHPLVLLHGGGSTIGTTFGRILPRLAESHRVIAVELQAHGHTQDRAAPETFQQDVEDVAGLLERLHVSDADVLGFSNGGQTAMQLAMAHPELVDRLVLASTFYARDGVDPAFWQSLDHASLSDMPRAYQDAFLKITGDSAALRTMFEKDLHRMQTFRGWTDANVRSIQAPTLVVIGDMDVPRPEHAVAMWRLLPHGRLLVLPGAHGAYLGDAATADPKSDLPGLFVSLVEDFLAASANAGRGQSMHAYHTVSR